MPKIKVIIGSNRPTRFADQPGQWITDLAKNINGVEVELIDVAALNLPFMDEPHPPMMGNYQNAHTKEWAKVIGDADGFVFVVAEYNHGYTAVLKNAIDYLYAEWLNKPVAFVSYGASAGGARAVEQLRAVVGQLSMFDLSENVILPEYYTNLKDGAFQFDERHHAAATAMLNRLVFWAEHMKQARAELSES